MWVYFNVPEAGYLEYKNSSDREKKEQRIELRLANGSKFTNRSTGKVIAGEIGAIGAKLNNETGTGMFRADFENPEGLLRHGMTGTILIHKVAKNAIVIPQRATFEVLDKRYVFVVDSDGKVRQREIFVQNELEDIYVIKSGLGVSDRFVVEGIRQVRDGERCESEFRSPEVVLAHLNYHAE